ncbi:MAG: 50S ribosomal protein L19 [Candidatus Shapirobacteria bacterium]|nr:50S ribosomal protein L19 [Candidatus Shapirobacteria bacterium]MDD5073717.1 50S ribosomal protein L19 [Candidatus Shapirobacteria bacterium]MDD5481706.1 50S ribosomal protein L19 [Candidatus Shapirobacteria bacterium]
MAETKEKTDQKKTDQTSKAKTKKIAEFGIGDRVRVYFEIKEGKQTRQAFFEGQVIAQKGSGKSQTFTVRRIGADRVAIERIFPKNSPKISRIDLTEKGGKFRRAKLYYLRNKIGR